MALVSWTRLLCCASEEGEGREGERERQKEEVNSLH